MQHAGGDWLPAVSFGSLGFVGVLPGKLSVGFLAKPSLQGGLPSNLTPLRRPASGILGACSQSKVHAPFSWVLRCVWSMTHDAAQTLKSA